MKGRVRDKKISLTHLMKGTVGKQGKEAAREAGGFGMKKP